MAKEKALVDRAERALAKRLDKSGYRHCMGVAAMAQTMATIYGQDAHDAFLAGMLHDWDKCRTNKELIADAKRYGIKITKVIKDRPRLLHAHTGACGVAETFPEMKPEIIAAIDNHTVGSVPMTDLDMIVYIADMIEPGRNFRRVNEFREMVGSISLEKLFRICYQYQMQHLVMNEKVMHPNTLKVWNWIVLSAHRHD
jgi:predicted HD superfamily hydrolase involved in NAD metabolism